MKNLIFKILLKIFKIPVVPKKDYMYLLARYYHAQGASNYHLASYCAIRHSHETNAETRIRLEYKERAAKCLRKEYYMMEDEVREGRLNMLKCPKLHNED